MKFWMIVVITLMMLFSFFLVYMLSPSNEAYIKQFNDDQYVTLATYDVPTDGDRILNVQTNIPFHLKIERRDVDEIQIQFNKMYSQEKLDYIRDGLAGEVYIVPDTGVRVNFDIDLEKPLLHYRSETFNSVLCFQDYKTLFDKNRYPEGRILIPQNYQLEQR